MAMRRSAKAFIGLLVTIGIVVALVLATKLAMEVNERRLRGALLENTDDASWIVATDSVVVIGLRGPRDGTYRVIRVDPETLTSTVLDAGDGTPETNASDRDWLYWSVYGGGSKTGTYVMPLSVGAVRKVSDKCARSIGLGAGRAYFSLRGASTGPTEEDDDIWVGKLGEGPERKLSEPAPGPASMKDLVNGNLPPTRIYDYISVDDSQAVWMTYGRFGSSERTEASMQRVRHDQTTFEKFASPCGHAVYLLHGNAGTFYVCRANGRESIMLQPTEGGPARELYSPKKARDLCEHGRYLYLAATDDTPRGEDSFIVRVPSAGGAAERLNRFGERPFAIGAGRLWYRHHDGVAARALEL